MGRSFVATWLRSDTRTFAVCGAAGWPGMVEPMALSPIPSHQSQLTSPAPMSVARWLAMMPPPSFVKPRIASRSDADHSGPAAPERPSFPPALKKNTASYPARFASVKIRGFLSGCWHWPTAVP